MNFLAALDPTVQVALIGAFVTLLTIFLNKFGAGRKERKQIKEAVDTGNGMTLGKYATLINDKVDLLTNGFETLKDTVETNHKETLILQAQHEVQDEQRFFELERKISANSGDQ